MIPGTLYGIGVGPGDPELIPVKAVRVLKTVDIIYTAASTKNTYSKAVTIAGEYIPEGTPVESLAFPMTQDKTEMATAWEAHARTILAQLESGKNAAFLTLGDPLTYATYGYVLQSIQAIAPDARIETIPGITSYQAAAARVNLPLVEGEESLLITSGVHGGDHLRRCKPSPENVVFMKAYKNAADISLALEERGMIDRSVGIISCGLPEEEIIEDVRAFKDRKPGYWTIIIAKKNPSS